jgi:hypothetical protein
VRAARLFMAEAAAIKAKHSKLQANSDEKTKAKPDEETEARPNENFPNLDRALKTFVSECVKSMLSQLYRVISKIEDDLKPTTSIAKKPNNSNQEILKAWIKTLYSDSKGNIYIVGPVGERPIHCCVFAIARHRARQGEASQCNEEKYISDGILDGIKEYEKEESEKNENESNTSRLYEEYGKDYCAAVGCFLWDKTREPGKNLPDLKGLRPSTDLDSESAPVEVEDLWHFLPYIRQVIMWLRNHEKGNRYHTRLGMYEGETPHFALIACYHEEAVNWFISVEEEETNLPKRCAQFIIDSILS